MNAFLRLFIVVELFNFMYNIICECSEGIAVGKMQFKFDSVISCDGARVKEQSNESVDGVNHRPLLGNLPEHRPSHDQSDRWTGFS